MKEITLKVPDIKLQFFLELIDQLGIEISEKSDIPRWQQVEVRKRIKLVEEGKLKVHNWDDLKTDIFE